MFSEEEIERLLELKEMYINEDGPGKVLQYTEDNIHIDIMKDSDIYRVIRQGSDVTVEVECETFESLIYELSS